MIESLQGGYQTQAITYTAQGAKKQDTVQPMSPGDTVSLSGSGRLMADFFAGIGVTPSSNGAVSLDDIKAAMEQKQQALEEDIDALFRENDIATSPSVTLTTDGEGRVRVQGDHPQKAEIEALFEESPELSNDFRAVSGLSSLVEAGKEYSEFAELYAQAPYTAVAQYGHLFNSLGESEFSMTVEGSTAASAEVSANTATQASAPDSVNPQAETGGTKPDFTNATRQELFDWINSEIVSGRMSLDNSISLVAMTLAFSDVDNQAVDMATDTKRYDFIEMARGGLEGALYRGDTENAELMQETLKLMDAA
ncbi:hypothetical protein [Desulfovibrio inopinatus]|uniref:hypothetical protein n=1 Tax=Desulfovibrio inopinatus TaxID=102109 RepID=UPI00040F7582|nr:hypothetical protein [Desulfovibrio inopinatus]